MGGSTSRKSCDVSVFFTGRGVQLLEDNEVLHALGDIKEAIDRFEGRDQDVQGVREHYVRVASRFGIEPMIVDSWHQGLHPGTDARPDPADDLCLWGETLFTSPQYLHFHTCGEYPPGEICWMVESPTLTLDGRKLYEDGRIRVDAFKEFSSCFNQHPELRGLKLRRG